MLFSKTLLYILDKLYKNVYAMSILKTKYLLFYVLFLPVCQIVAEKIFHGMLQIFIALHEIDPAAK